MTNRAIQKIPKDEIKRREDEARRTELAMLKLLAQKYPVEAKKFVGAALPSFSLTKEFV